MGVPIRTHLPNRARSVDVPLHEVTTEATVHAHRALEVHLLARAQ